MNILFLIVVALVSEVWLVDPGKSFQDEYGTKYIGNVLYVVQNERPVSVNPQLVNFHRRFDLTTIISSLDALDNFATAYHDFCAKTIGKRRQDFNCVVLPAATFREAQFKCLEFNAVLPEITNPVEANMLLAEMREHNLNRTFAGIAWVGERLTYLSNQQDILYHRVRPCKECAVTDMLTFEDYNTVSRTQGAEIHFYYEDIEGRLVITPHGHRKECPKLPIVCVRNDKPKETMLKTLAKHSCMRDKEEIKRTNQILRQEAFQFYRAVGRVKRGLGLVLGAGYLGTEAINSLATGKAPFAMIGQGIASALGIATAEDIRLTQKELEKHSKALKDLSINQQTLIEAHQVVSNEVAQLQSYNKRQDHDVAILYAELDNKVAIHNLQTLLQLTLLKMSAAIVSAAQHQPSPYVFGQEDLNNISLQFRSKAVILTSELTDIYTSLAIVENIYTFIFAAPIINPENYFYFYEIRDLPVYNDGKQYKIMTSIKYFGINSAKGEYVLVTESEYRTCMTYLVCNIASPFTKITSSAPCEIKTLKYNSQHCPMELSNRPSTNFISHKNVTYYSIPHEQEIAIVCSQSHIAFNQHKTIMGTGQIQTMPGCTIQAGDISVRPGFIASRHNLQSDTLFQILKVPEMAMSYPTEAPIEEVSRPTYTFKDVSTVEDAVGLIFNHDTVLAEAVRWICLIGIVVAIFTVIYCVFTPFREWIKGCCFCVKPTKYWRDVKGYNVPDFISKRRQKDEDNKPTAVDEQELEVFSHHSTLDTNSHKGEVGCHNVDVEKVESAPYPFNRMHHLYSPLLFGNRKPKQ